MNHAAQNDQRLIEAGFPCHQVGANRNRLKFEKIVGIKDAERPEARSHAEHGNETKNH